MAFRIPEMVQETTTASGTGAYGLLGAVADFRSFDDELSAVGPVLTLYTVFDTATPPNYEVNIGTWSTGSPPTLTRAQLLKSSTGFAIDWPGGGVVKNVVAGFPGVMVEGAFDPAAPGLVRQVGSILRTDPISAAGLNLVSSSDYASMRDLLNVVAGVNVQSWSTHLDTIAGAARTNKFVIIANDSIWQSRLLVAADLPIGSGNGIDADMIDGLHKTDLLSYETSTPLYHESTASYSQAASVAHGLGSVPRMIQIAFRCVTPEGGYSAGDELVMATAQKNYYNFGHAVWASSTHVGISSHYGAESYYTLARKDAANTFPFTAAYWNIVFRAWK